MRRRAFVVAPLAVLGTAAVRAQAAPPPEVASELPGARLQGGGRMRFMGFRVYDARLWTGAQRAGADWASVPLALELEYARHLVGTRIAERSLDEMRRQAEIGAEPAARWLATMKTLFPDVDEGDRITGVQRPGEGARFFFNGALRGEVRDPEFARLFFGIWLSPRTSEPALREALLGARP